MRRDSSVLHKIQGLNVEQNFLRDGSEVHSAGEGAGGEERGQVGGRGGGGGSWQWSGEIFIMVIFEC